MAAKDQNDDQAPEGTEGDPPKDEGKSAEDSFWAKFDERLDAAIDRGVTKHVPKRSPTSSGPRTEGRLTLPKIVADFLGGPFESESARQKSGK
jgi:hypothetical protein